ncbi:hypothetical protein V2J09_019972 [Rumex salicifolius]
MARKNGPDPTTGSLPDRSEPEPTNDLLSDSQQIGDGSNPRREKSNKTKDKVGRKIQFTIHVYLCSSLMRRLNAGARNQDPDSTRKPNMDSVKSLNFINHNPRSNTFSKSPRNLSSSSLKSKLVTVSLVAISALIFFVVVFRYWSADDGPKFRIIIDGGSTGTRIHVFEYRVEGGTPKFDFGPGGLGSMRVSPGLSAYADFPEDAGRSLMELLEFGKKRVPEQFWTETEISLMATAGLRLLDSKLQERILESCRGVLSFSGFKFRSDWASVISGSDEGLYAWVVANYAVGSLGGDPKETTGIIELGGASAQVTFVPKETPPSVFSHSITYTNITYTLYSHSLLEFGQNVAYDSLKELIVSGGLPSTDEAPMKGLVIDPCTPKGYPLDSKTKDSSLTPSAHKYSTSFQARGNFSDCRAAALTLLHQKKEQCSYQHCSVGSTFIPKIEGKFLATENFFHTSKFFGLPPELLLSDIMTAGKRFCENDWSSIRKEHPSAEDEALLQICFSSAYIVAFLHDSLGIALDDRRIKYTNNVDNVPLDWALGAFILQSSTTMNTNHLDWIPTLHSEDFSTLLLILLGSGILMFVAWSFSKWRKPCLKTIYDLEKGRYIVTRISH